MQDKTILTEETSSGKGQLLATFIWQIQCHVMPLLKFEWMKTRLFLKAAKKYTSLCVWKLTTPPWVAFFHYLHCYVSIRSGTMYWCSHKTRKEKWSVKFLNVQKEVKKSKRIFQKGQTIKTFESLPHTLLLIRSNEDNTIMPHFFEGGASCINLPIVWWVFYIIALR
jgi:hypothetical protein